MVLAAQHPDIRHRVIASSDRRHYQRMAETYSGGYTLGLIDDTQTCDGLQRTQAGALPDSHAWPLTTRHTHLAEEREKLFGRLQYSIDRSHGQTSRLSLHEQPHWVSKTSPTTSVTTSERQPPDREKTANRQQRPDHGTETTVSSNHGHIRAANVI